MTIVWIENLYRHVILWWHWKENSAELRSFWRLVNYDTIKLPQQYWMMSGLKQPPFLMNLITPYIRYVLLGLVQIINMLIAEFVVINNYRAKRYNYQTILTCDTAQIYQNDIEWKRFNTIEHHPHFLFSFFICLFEKCKGDNSKSLQKTCLSTICLIVQTWFKLPRWMTTQQDIHQWGTTYTHAK